MRLKKIICPILILALAVSCISTDICAKEIDGLEEHVIVSRATGRFTIEVPANGIRYGSTQLPMEYGETVTIKASYSPFKANLSFGLIDSENIFHYVTSTGGSIDYKFAISERGQYRFAVKNNSSYPVSVTGYINY